jgi:outer membrane receptor for ferrienterochelin and colicin
MEGQIRHKTMRTLSAPRISAALLLLGSLHLDVHSAGAEENPAAASPNLKELSIEELMEVDTVYGASRYEQKLSDAPSSVSVVTAAEINKFGYRTLVDLLRSVRGFHVTNDRN